MVSSVLPRLQTLLPAFALLILLGIALPEPAHAVVHYSDRAEGDPGDGVLDPAFSGDNSVDYGGGSSGGSNYADPLASTSEPGIAEIMVLTLDRLYLVPVHIPGGFFGRSTVIFLPRMWTSARSSSLFSEGRWHHAP